MPSASTKPDSKASSEATEPIKQAINVVDKKVRNLEKRKGKLDAYRQKRTDGETLNKDQEIAVSCYDGVVQNLEFARELQKQFIAINAETEKILKKQTKRDKLERQALEVKRMKELLQLQNILDSLGSDSAREDFQQGQRGAVVLTEENLNQLDELYKLISPTRDGETNYLEALTAASEHIVNFLDGREKEVAATTYKDLKALVDKVNECGYFDNLTGHPEEAEEAAPEPEAAVPAAEPAPEDKAEPAETPEYEYEEPLEEPAAEIEEEVLPVRAPTPPMAAAAAVVVPSGLVEAEVEQGEAVAPGGAVFDQESFFATASYANATRPFNEIVSSVQGTFNFLQDSQIDVDSPHMDPAVVAARPMAAPSLPHPSQQPESSLTAGYQSPSLLVDDQLTQSQILAPQLQSESQADTATAQQPPQQPTQPPQASSQHPTQNPSSLAAQQAMDSAYSPDTDFGQNLMSQGLQAFSSEPSGFGGSAVGGGMESGVSGEVPPAIPMPNQGSLSQGLGSQDPSPDGQEKKPFAMNPNAAMFQSMYQSSQGGGGGPHMTQASSAQMSGAAAVNTLAGQDKYSQNQQGHPGGDYQDYKGQGYGQQGGGYQRNGNAGGRGSGPRGGGGRGGRGGNMSNGFPGARSNRGGGGGMYQGYPPRSDYRPEGFQGYSNGYNNYNKRGGAGGPPRGAGGRGGVMRGGPGQRGGGGMRGGNRGGGGSYGSRPGSGGPQQHSGSPIQQAAA